MGKDAKLRRERNKVVHIRKFDTVHGMTPQQMHVEALGRKCPCGLDACCSAISFAPLAEFARSDHGLAMLGQIMARNGGSPPVVEFTYGKFVKIGETFSCEMCRPAMEKAAAMGPSWVQVEIRRGPGPSRPSVQVPGGDT
jgi:hypothetical protein